jgi:hypothetical protein
MAIDRKFADAVLAAAAGLCVAGAIYLMLNVTRQRTPVEAQMVTALGAAGDVAALVNSEAFQARVAQALTTSEGVAPSAIADDLKFLRVAAKRADLLEIRTLSSDEAVGKKLVNAVAREILNDPIRFRLADLGKRYALFSAVRDQSAECARSSAAAASRIAMPQLMQVKVQSLFLAAGLLRELEQQGPAGNFLKHLDAMKSLGLERLPADSRSASYSDYETLYNHALCESTHALATAQFAITDNLVRTEYRLLYPASAQPKTAGRGKVKNLMLAIPAGLIAAWLALHWRARTRRRG